MLRVLDGKTEGLWLMVRHQKEFGEGIENSSSNSSFKDLGVVSISGRWWWFEVWLFLALWLGVMWIMVQYGRDLLGKVRAIYSHPSVVEYWNKKMNNVEQCDLLTDVETSHEEGNHEE